MIAVGIDIGKNKHAFSIYDSDTGVVCAKPSFFENNKAGFESLLTAIKPYENQKLMIGMEDTGHYHFALLKFLLERNYTVCLINPVSTDLARKMQGGITKNDELDTLNICDIISSGSRKKAYRITKVSNYALYEQKMLTRHHHNLKEELNVYTNRLQKCIDIIFPEYNSLFKSKYGHVYNEVLKTFGSAEVISKTDIRSLRKCFEYKGRGKRISLTAEELKQAAKDSIGINSTAEVIQVRHLIDQIELINEQISEIDKKIEEFSIQNNSPILSIPGIAHFSGTSILSEIGDICNYTKASQIIKLSGCAPYEYKSSQYEAKHLSITKKGSRYLRKTLYQIIMPVIENNEVFGAYYKLKISQGKSHRCAQGHCVRKLLRLIFHLLKTNQQFDPNLLR